MSQKVLKFKGKSNRDHEKAQNFRLRRSIMKKTLINLLFMKKNRRPKGGENFWGQKLYI